MPEPDVHGPIDLIVIEFPAESGGAATTAALIDLVERGIVRLYDLMVVRKEADGSCTEIDLSMDADGDLVELRVLSGARSGLVGTDDVSELAALLEPGTVAAALLYENAWAVPFVAAARSEGAELIASARLSAQEIMDALDAVEAD
jgi:hypothetical protein